jgi:hypothetical protein
MLRSIYRNSRFDRKAKKKAAKAKEINLDKRHFEAEK